MTLADYTQAVLAASIERREKPITEDDLRPDQRTTISTARLMNVEPRDCELLVCGELVPWPARGGA